MTPNFHILLVAATAAEIAPTVAWLREGATREEKNVVFFARCSVEVFVTGVGPVVSAHRLGCRFSGPGRVDLAVQAGIAGAIDRGLPLGSVVQVTSERMGDVGAQDRDGAWLTTGDLGFPAGPPFGAGEILRLPPDASQTPFPAVAGITVSQTTGTEAGLDRLRERWPAAQVETMEGAAFFLSCLDGGVTPIQVRSISNYVEARNREGWRLGPALNELNGALRQLLTPFVEAYR